MNIRNPATALAFATTALVSGEALLAQPVSAQEMSVSPVSAEYAVNPDAPQLRSGDLQPDNSISGEGWVAIAGLATLFAGLGRTMGRRQ